MSWQTVPTRLIELITDPDPGVVDRVTQAMLQMIEIDVPTLEAAAAS